MLAIRVLFCLLIQVASEVIEFIEELKVRDGSWELDISVVQNEDLPTGTPDLCGERPPAIADDGVPYLMWRPFFHTLSAKTQTATGFKFIECDWQPCGHPTLANFGKPHWDCHFFYTDYDYQQSIAQCETGASPVCTPPPYVQSTEIGRGYFDYGTAANNMPLHFTVDQESAVPAAGVHWFDQRPEHLPKVSEWVEPILIMGSYGGQMNFWESMVPVDFLYQAEASCFDIEYNPLNELDFLPTDYCVTTPKDNINLNFKIHGAKQPCDGVCGEKTICNLRTGMCESDCQVPQPCCDHHDKPSCGGVETDAIPACVCDIDPFCCSKNGHWDSQCIQEAADHCQQKC